MFRRFAIAALVTLGASLCAIRASAQTATVVVPFSGNISSTCAFSSTAAGSLAFSDTGGSQQLLASTTVGLPGTTTLTCNAASTLSVSDPVLTSVPTGAPSTVQSASVRSSGTNVFACSIGAGSIGVSGCTGASNTTLPIPGSGANNYQVYMTVGAINGGTFPAGSYAYGVTLTAATP